MIPLLSGKPLSEFTPQSFKEYVKSLYFKPEPKGRKPSRGFSCRVNEKGTLIITLRRKMKYLTESELQDVKKETGKPLNEIFLYCKKREIVIVTDKDGKRLQKGEK